MLGIESVDVFSGQPQMSEICKKFQSVGYGAASPSLHLPYFNKWSPMGLYCFVQLFARLLFVGGALIEEIYGTCRFRGCPTATLLHLGQNAGRCLAVKFLKRPPTINQRHFL